MRDIQTREDIILIMRGFYDKLLKDEAINFFFISVTDVNHHLEEHFEILAVFWEQALFLKGGYHNNMFQKHKDVHDKFPFTKDHFDIWLRYLYATLDEMFVGEKVEQMKTQALNMATVLQIKFSNEKRF